MPDDKGKELKGIEISTISIDKIGFVKPLLEKSRQKPYRFLLSDLQGNQLDSFWLNDISNLSRGEQGEVFFALKDSKVISLIAFIELPWETRVLENRMGVLKNIIVDPGFPKKRKIIKLLLDYVINWAVSRKVEFLMCKIYSDNISTIHALEHSGFLLMDTQLDYVYDIRKCPLKNVPRPSLCKGASIRLAKDNDKEELVAVANAAFRNHFGRFHSDQRISKKQAVQVYEEWMRSSCEGYADWIMVAEIDGKLAGFSVWKKSSPQEQSFGIKLGHYSIGAVHPDYQRIGLFSALTYSGMELFDGIADFIEGPTHINHYSVQRAYGRLLWQIRDARHSFHKWLIP